MRFLYDIKNGLHMPKGPRILRPRRLNDTFRNLRHLPDEQDVYVTEHGVMANFGGRLRYVPAGGAVDMTKGKAHFYDDFLGPFSSAANALIASRCIYTVASSATCARRDINGGAARITMGGDDADAVALFGPTAYEPDEASRVWFKVRFQITDVDVSSVFVGFSDADTDTVIIEDEGGTLNTVASDAFGLMLEGEEDETWQTVGVQGDTDNAQAALSDLQSDLADNTWTTVFIEADATDNGRMRVFIDGALVNTANTDTNGWTTSFLDSSVTYVPAVSVDDRNTGYSVDVAEFEASGGVGTVFD